MNILITGSNGFIGQNLTSHLLREGHSLYLLTRKAQSASFIGLNYISIDLSIPGFSRMLPQRIDCIIHLAQSSRYRDFPDGTYDMLRVNINSTVELLEWSRHIKVKQFIFTSTANVYTPSMDILIEESATNPTSFYGASKLAAETCALQYQNFFQVDILRCFTVYGPGQTNMLISNLIKRIENGSLITLAERVGIFLTPIYINDLLAIISRLLKPPRPQEAMIFNVCGDEIVPLSNVVMTIEKCLNRQAILQMTGETPLSLAGSNNKLKSTLNLSEFTSLEKGIELTTLKEVPF
jgi:nucleoside-diphosphate-sugar epimerase